MALAVTKRLPECSVVLWGRNEERVDQIRRGGSVEATCDLAQAVSSAELVVLAVPVGAMGPLGKQVLKIKAIRLGSAFLAGASFNTP